MHLYSRLPLHDGKIQFLVEPDLPSFHVAVELSRLQRLPAFGSDHFPILVELVLVENLQY